MQLYSYRVLGTLSIGLLLGACTYTGQDNHLTGNAAGPVLGATAGVAATSVLGAPRPLVVTAGIGGAALGYYMTTLRFDAGPIVRSGGEVYSQGDYAGISIPNYRVFEPNTAELLPEAEPILESAVAVLKRYPNSNIMVSDNTNGFGTHRLDQRLSLDRARVISSYLWAHGISSFKQRSIETRKLSYVGYGDYFPVGDTSDSKNLQVNSRIQITAYPSQKDLKLDKRSMAFNNVGALSEKEENGQ